MDRFVIIDSLSINQDTYFKEDGSRTKSIEEAMVVNSISEGEDKVKFMTLYQPIFQPI